MKNIKRIAVIGNAGSGKSTLTRQLHNILKLPVYHLDKYYWKPGWVPVDPLEYSQLHDMLCERDEWIMDGMNLRLLLTRIDAADMIIFLDIPRYKCLWRVIKRTLMNYGKERLDSPAGCPEGFSFAFLKFLKWVWKFKKYYKPRIYAYFKMEQDFQDEMHANDGFQPKEFYVLRSQKEIDEFLKTLKS